MRCDIGKNYEQLAIIDVSERFVLAFRWNATFFLGFIMRLGG